MTSSIRLGTGLPQFGDAVDDARRIAEFARRAEEAGAASLWAADRLVAAVDPQVGYQGTDTVPERFRRVLDPFVTLAVAASATTTATLGTSVLVGPLYPPAELARSLVSLQAVSGGRMLAGLGIGWSPEEYAAAGVGFDHRGARFDELLDALGVLFDGGQAGYDGRYVHVPRVHVESPAPRIPVGLAGYSDAALARVGRRADVWLPSVMLPGPRAAEEIGPWLQGRRAVLDRAAETAGRDPSAVGTALRVNLGPDAAVAEAVAGLATVLETTGITDVFVDAMAVAPRPDESLATFAAVRDALAP